RPRRQRTCRSHAGASGRLTMIDVHPIIDKNPPPFREARLMPVDLAVERLDDGVVLLESRIKLEDFDANLPAAFARAAARQPDKIALAWRVPGQDGWRSIS